MWKNAFKIAFCSLLLSSGLGWADYTIRTADSPPKVLQVFSFICQTSKICQSYVMTDSNGVEKATVANPAIVSTGNPPGIVLCTTLPPAPIAVTATPQSQQLGVCGPSVVVINDGLNEMYIMVGPSNLVPAATPLSHPIPAGGSIQLTNAAGAWISIVAPATLTTTARFIQGTAY